VGAPSPRYVESRETAIALNDQEILEAQSLTGSFAGIFVEPAAATSVAAAKKLRQANVMGRNDTLVCNLTGHGLNSLRRLTSKRENSPRLNRRFERCGRR